MSAKRSFAWGIVLAAMAAGCASTPALSNRGMVTVGGLAPSQVLAAIDTTKLVGTRPQHVAANQPADSAADTDPQSPRGKTVAVEGVAPSAVLAAIDPRKLVTPPESDNTNKGR
jgi:hypothetical protein